MTCLFAKTGCFPYTSVVLLLESTNGPMSARFLKKRLYIVYIQVSCPIPLHKSIENQTCWYVSANPPSCCSFTPNFCVFFLEASGQENEWQHCIGLVIAAGLAGRVPGSMWFPGGKGPVVTMGFNAKMRGLPKSWGTPIAGGFFMEHPN